MHKHGHPYNPRRPSRPPRQACSLQRSRPNRPLSERQLILCLLAAFVVVMVLRYLVRAGNG